MEKWINNLDDKTFMIIMLNTYLLDKTKEVLNTDDIGHSYRQGSLLQMWVELRKLPEKSDILINDMIKSTGLDKYIKTEFEINKNYLYILFNINSDMTKDDMESISGILLLLGYGNKM